MIADNNSGGFAGNVVAKIGSVTTSGSIRVYDKALDGNSVDVAVAGSGGNFSSLDSLPGISDDGNTIAFYGIDNNNNPGIFVVTADNGGSFANSKPYPVVGP